MQIGKILFPVTTLGPGRRAGVWVTGCNRRCEGCSNPELRIFDESKDLSVEEVFEIVRAFGCDGVTVSGGEPFLQAAELKRLVELLRGAGMRDILMYTGFTYEQLAAADDADIDYVLHNIAVLIDGEFVKELADGVPLRGSSNQRVIVIDGEFKDAYERALAEEKRVNVFHFGGETHFIGIPLADGETIYSDYVKYGRKK